MKPMPLRRSMTLPDDFVREAAAGHSHEEGVAPSSCPCTGREVVVAKRGSAMPGAARPWTTTRAATSFRGRGSPPMRVLSTHLVKSGGVRNIGVVTPWSHRAGKRLHVGTDG